MLIIKKVCEFDPRFIRAEYRAPDGEVLYVRYGVRNCLAAKPQWNVLQLFARGVFLISVSILSSAGILLAIVATGGA